MKFEVLRPKWHDRAKFDCGVESLNLYLKRFAGQDQKRHLNKLYVLADNKKIIGYYSLSSHSVPRDNLPQNLQLGGYGELPFLLLGRLAVDQSFQGQGYGDALIVHAFSTTVVAAQYIGVLGMIVDAKNDSAASFYEGFGFVRLQNSPKRLVISFKEIQAWLAN